MMSYEEFEKKVKDNLTTWLPPEMQDAEVRLIQAPGKHRTSICASMGTGPQSIVNLGGFYDQYCAGEMDMSYIMEQIASAFTDKYGGIKMGEENDPLQQLLEKEHAMEHLVPRLVNMKTVELEEIPHRILYDMAVVYYVRVPDHLVSNNNEKLEAEIAVSQQLLESWKMSEDDLYRTAVANIQPVVKPYAVPMSEYMEHALFHKSMEHMDISNLKRRKGILGMMLVLTNDGGQYGASAILDPVIQRHISEFMGGDYVILPSSVNEIFVHPLSGTVNLDSLEEMNQTVFSANRDFVPPGKVLSDVAYAYDSKEKEIIPVSKYAERMKSQEILTEKNRETVQSERHRGKSR